MNADEYFKQRLQDQIEWYDRKSLWNQKYFKRLRTSEIICAGAIPLLSGFLMPETLYLKIIVGVLGLVISVIAGVLSVFKFQENWIEYRATSEMLKHEKYLFLAEASPYNVRDAFLLLVARVESLISKENSNWAQYIKSAREKQKG